MIDDLAISVICAALCSLLHSNNASRQLVSCQWHVSIWRDCLKGCWSQRYFTSKRGGFHFPDVCATQCPSVFSTSSSCGCCCPCTYLMYYYAADVPKSSRDKKDAEQTSILYIIMIINIRNKTTLRLERYSSNSNKPPHQTDRLV